MHSGYVSAGIDSGNWNGSKLVSDANRFARSQGSGQPVANKPDGAAKALCVEPSQVSHDLSCEPSDREWLNLFLRSTTAHLNKMVDTMGRATVNLETGILSPAPERAAFLRAALEETELTFRRWIGPIAWADLAATPDSDDEILVEETSDVDFGDDSV